MKFSEIGSSRYRSGSQCADLMTENQQLSVGA